MEFEAIFQKMENLIYGTIYKETGSNFIKIWNEKLWKYLAYCINGGMTNNLVMLDEILTVNKKLNYFLNPILDKKRGVSSSSDSEEGTSRNSKTKDEGFENYLR